jgi:purine-binding chemotaxis protein CheW
VVTFGQSEIKPAPELGAVPGMDYLIGLRTLDDRMLILTDINKLMASEDLGMLEKLAA